MTKKMRALLIICSLCSGTVEAQPAPSEKYIEKMSKRPQPQSRQYLYQEIRNEVITNCDPRLSMEANSSRSSSATVKMRNVEIAESTDANIGIVVRPGARRKAGYRHSAVIKLRNVRIEKCK